VIAFAQERSHDRDLADELRRKVEQLLVRLAFREAQIVAITMERDFWQREALVIAGRQIEHLRAEVGRCYVLRRDAQVSGLTP
jgi:hypothetical protein